MRGSCFGRIFHRQQMLRSMQMYGGRYRDRVFFPLSTCVRAVLPRRREGVLWSADRPWSKMLLQEGEMRSKDRGLVSTTLRYRKSSERNTVYSSLTWFRRQIVGMAHQREVSRKKKQSKNNNSNDKNNNKKKQQRTFPPFFLSALHFAPLFNIWRPRIAMYNMPSGLLTQHFCFYENYSIETGYTEKTAGP